MGLKTLRISHLKRCVAEGLIHLLSIQREYFEVILSLRRMTSYLFKFIFKIFCYGKLRIDVDS